jgi:protein-disulfide isomerase
MKKLNPPVGEQDHFKGDRKSSIILVEYGDLQCPYCGEAYPVIKEIEKKFKTQLAFVFRHFPLREVHPYAEAAAVATEAAARQGKFWEMHDLIYENQMKLGPEFLSQSARQLHLDMHAFLQDINDEELADKVEASFESGVISGVNGTPSFYINGTKYEGSYDLRSLSRAIEAAISTHPVAR